MDSDNNEVSVLSLPSDGHSSNEGTEGKRRALILEPAVLLVFFALNLSGIQIPMCFKSRIHQVEIETKVQPYAANIFMARSIFESIIPATGSLFIGPWSDKFGRKPVILASFMGYCSIHVISSVIAFLSTKFIINPWVYILAVIPISLSGGNCSLITGIFCYITDIAIANERAYRMVLIEAAIYIGLLFGSVLSSYVLAATNCASVFMISGALVFLAIIYIIFFLKESLSPEKIDRGPKLRGLFRWELVKDMFHTCFEKRPNYDRMIIWLTMLTLGIAIFTMEGNANVFFLFVREKFSWTIKDYTLYEATSIITQIFGNVIVVYFLQKILRLSITSIALIAFGSCVLDSVIKATGTYSWHLYLAIGVSLLKAVGCPMCRAIISHVVPGSDLGKIFSLTTSIEAITPLGSSPLYTYVYNSTLTKYPGAFNFISCGMYFTCYVFLAIVYGIQKTFAKITYETIGS